MEKDRRTMDTQLRKIEQDYSRCFGKLNAPQQTEAARQGYSTQFTAYENVQVFTLILQEGRLASRLGMRLIFS